MDDLVVLPSRGGGRLTGATEEGQHATEATDNVFGEDMERVVDPADVDEMHSLHDPTSVVVIEVVEPHHIPNQKGKTPDLRGGRKVSLH